MRTVNEFIESATEHLISSWPIRDCSMCGTELAYLIDLETMEVTYRSNCNCVTYYSEPEPRTWQSIVDHYNMQSHPDVIAKYDEFWHFKPAALPVS